MALTQFNTRILDNVRAEADWLADETYQILPREEVQAIVTMQVSDGANGTKNVAYIRTKTNTTDGKRLFKELEYNDEYVTLKLEALESVNGNITNLTNDLNILTDDFEATKTDVEGMAGTVATLSTSVTKNTGDISTLNTTVSDLKTKVEAGPDTSALEQRVTDAESDIETLITNTDSMASTVAGMSSKITAAETAANNAMPKSGGTFTGDVMGVTPTAGDNTTKLATTAFVKNALDNIEIPDTGISVILSSTQPTTQKSGDIWLKQV